jgi:hypothetical protein
MAEWYQRHSQLPKTGWPEIEASEAGFYAGGGDLPVTGVRVTATGGLEQFFAVEHGPDGDRIEWESSVGYNPDLAGLISNGNGGRSQTVRVLGCLDNYYNFTYGDPGVHLCVRLHDPSTREVLGYGYIPMHSADAESIASYLDGAFQDELRPLMIDVHPGVDSPKTHQVEIVRMVEAGWRSFARTESESTELPN